MTNLARHLKATVFVFSSICPTLTEAQNLSSDDVLQEFSTLLTFGNETTDVSLDQCTLSIQTRVRTSCTYQSEPNWKYTTIDLSEVHELELRPFREGYVLSLEFDVPRPSQLQTLAIRLSDGEQAALDFVIAESTRLLNETELRSNVTFQSCTGETFEQPRSRVLSIFLDDVPQTWDDFELLVQNCK